MTRTDVYVPVAGSDAEAMIDRGAGVVGRRVCEGEVLVYYEGWRLGGESLPRYAQRVARAAERMHFDGGRGYPTRARGTFAARDLVWIGQLEHGETGVRLSVRDHDTLAGWLGVGETVPAEELQLTR
jgi:hypothetical protein